MLLNPHVIFVDMYETLYIGTLNMFSCLIYFTINGRDDSDNNKNDSNRIKHKIVFKIKP